MRKTMVTIVVAVLFASFPNSNSVAQPVIRENWDPALETHFVTTYDPTIKPPKTSSAGKRIRLQKKRPALWLDIYTFSFLSATSILGAILVSWRLSVWKAKSPRPLFEQTACALHISPSSKPKRSHRLSARVGGTRRSRRSNKLSAKQPTTKT